MSKAGSYYFKGGSSALTAALVKHIEDRGGTVQASSEVKSIMVDAAQCCIWRYLRGFHRRTARSPRAYSDG
jgi:phytoene dehydrogenase-like protein